MPYKKISDLPESVQDSLPTHAQEIYRAAYNSAYEQYDDSQDREETAHKVAWSAVKNEYHKNDAGTWIADIDKS